MNSFFDWLGAGGFMPHGHCYLWAPSLVWLHATSDGLIALAYFSIPVALLHFIRKRKDVPYRAVFVMFGLFIVACGLTHVIEVVAIWHGFYYLSGTVKAATAAISLATAVLLFRVMPEAVQFATPEELRRVNESLEERVHERTSELEEANKALRREISERESAETEIIRLNELLQRRIDELQALFNVLPVGVGIAEDPACKTIRTNDAFARMLGLPTNANASMSADPDHQPRGFRVLHNGKVLSPDKLPMQSCARENREVVGFEETIERSDGITIDLLANVVPLRKSDGSVAGCVGTFQDVSALKAALAANARYAAIVESSQDGIIGKTLKGIVTDWNPGAEHIFGYSADEMIGQPIKRLAPEDRVGEMDDILARIGRGENIPQFESVRRRKDGKLINVSIVISPILDSSGTIIGASKLVRDITERIEAETLQREMERKILDTQKLESLGVLAGGIAHDFNNLLTGILGNASLARQDLHSSSPVLSTIQQIELAARRAAELCRQMLAYSGRGSFVQAPLDINQLITETTHLLSVSISKNCVLRFNLTPDLPAVIADASQIRQVVMNLVINASEAIDQRSGIIGVATGVARVDKEYLETLRYYEGVETGTFVYIEVSDTGIGMDAAALEKIFDPFFTTKFTGRGLGLAAVLGIVRSHKGALKVYSVPKRGTTFKLLLPCSGKAILPETPKEKRSVTGLGKGLVLVVDDEETVRAVAARIVEGLGFTVELAEDGRKALEKFARQPTRYQFVLLDLTMPHMDGEETFRQMRNLHPGVRVILMSGFGEQEAVARFSGKGLAGFVQKPFEVEALAEVVRTAKLAG